MVRGAHCYWFVFSVESASFFSRCQRYDALAPCGRCQRASNDENRNEECCLGYARTPLAVRGINPRCLVAVVLPSAGGCPKEMGFSVLLRADALCSLMGKGGARASDEDGRTTNVRAGRACDTRQRYCAKSRLGVAILEKTRRCVCV